MAVFFIVQKMLNKISYSKLKKSKKKNGELMDVTITIMEIHFSFSITIIFHIQTLPSKQPKF